MPSVVAQNVAAGIVIWALALAALTTHTSPQPTPTPSVHAPPHPPPPSFHPTTPPHPPPKPNTTAPLPTPTNPSTVAPSPPPTPASTPSTHPPLAPAVAILSGIPALAFVATCLSIAWYDVDPASGWAPFRLTASTPSWGAYVVPLFGAVADVVFIEAPVLAVWVAWGGCGTAGEAWGWAWREAVASCGGVVAGSVAWAAWWAGAVGVGFVVVAANDGLASLCHEALHASKWLYTHVHKVHHMPLTAWCASTVDDHWAERLAVETLVFRIGLLALLPAPLPIPALAIVFAVNYVDTAINHSGLAVPPSAPSPWWLPTIDGRYHWAHHAYGNRNYCEDELTGGLIDSHIRVRLLGLAPSHIATPDVPLPKRCSVPTSTGARLCASS